MTDIVEKLRSVTSLTRETNEVQYEQDDALAAEAADEIVSLRFQLDGVIKMRNEADAKVRHLMQTHDDMADEMERLRSGMIQMAEAMATQVATIERLRAALMAFADHFGPLENNIMLHEGARRCFALARAALGDTPAPKTESEL